MTDRESCPTCSSPVVVVDGVGAEGTSYYVPANVPRPVADSLAGALESIYREFVAGCVEERFVRQVDPVADRAYQALAVYRAAYPEETP